MPSTHPMSFCWLYYCHVIIQQTYQQNQHSIHEYFRSVLIFIVVKPEGYNKDSFRPAYKLISPTCNLSNQPLLMYSRFFQLSNLCKQCFIVLKLRLASHSQIPIFVSILIVFPQVLQQCSIYSTMFHTFSHMFPICFPGVSHIFRDFPIP